jgi:hypothetical protein
MTPTALSLRMLRRRGYLVDVCERTVPHTDPPIKRDLFGGFDLAALHLAAPGTTYVQTTSLSNLPARVAKLRGLPSVALCLKAGNAVQLHGWLKRGRRWAVKIVELKGADCDPVTVEAPRRRTACRHRQGQLFNQDA